MNNHFYKIFATMLFLAIMYPTRSYSQHPNPAAVDQATREADRPDRKEVEKMLQTIPEMPKKPEAEKKKIVTSGPQFLLKQINFTGLENLTAEDFEPVTSKYINTKINMQDLDIVADAIKREYLRQGFIAACFVPPQEIKDGIVTLQIVEAKMGKLEIRQNSKLFDEERLRNYWTIKPGEVIDYYTMYRSISLMNNNPDREVQTTMHAGSKPGTTDIIAKVKTFFPIHFFGSWDREGAVSSGRERSNLGIKHNNFLFVDDTLITSVNSASDSGGWYAYHTVPVTNFGTSVMYGYSDSIVTPKKEFRPFGIKTRTQSTSLFVRQAYYKKDEYLGEFSIGLDAKEKLTRNVSGTTTKERLRLLRMGGTYYHRYPGCITYLNPEFTQGLNFLGATPESRLTSREAGSTFSLFNLSIDHTRVLPFDANINIKFAAQVASERLPSSEEFFLGGIDSVRGYTSGEYLADDAFQTNVELRVPAFCFPERIKLPYDSNPLKDILTWIIFFDQGYGFKRAPFEYERERASLASFGTGLRIQLYDQISLRFEWGFPVGDRPQTEVASSRFHFKISFEEKLDKEFDRIKTTLQKEKLARRHIEQANSLHAAGKTAEAEKEWEKVVSLSDDNKTEKEN